MWWFAPTALAGPYVPPVLAQDCADPQLAMSSARAHWEAEGLPPGTVALEIGRNAMCCVAVTARPVDAAGIVLPGSLSLNHDCTLLGISTEPTRDAAWKPGIRPLEGEPQALSGASLLRPAHVALLDRADRATDLLVAVRTRKGWDVWLVRPRGAGVVMTVARVALDHAGTLRKVVDDVHPWVPPPGAEAARAVASLEDGPFL